MSTENFNTMRKGGGAGEKLLPPIEFQDSPQTRFTLNYAQRLANNIIQRAIKDIALGYCSSYIRPDSNTQASNSKINNFEKKKSTLDTETLKKKIMSNSQMIYGSDSFLNNYNKFEKYNIEYEYSTKVIKDSISNTETDNENIYDEPNTEYDVIYKDKSDLILSTKRIVRSYDKTKKKIYADHSEIYFNETKNGSIDNNNHTLKVDESGSFHRKFDNFLRKKFLNTSANLTPTTTTSSILFQRINSPIHNCHQQHCNLFNLSTSNRPNSRNSLNSGRLSSSHNSLTVQKSNKADDSIFITQAMSQDALQISDFIPDFYNVPIGSDIYAHPYDAVKQQLNSEKLNSKAKKSLSYSDNNLLDSTTNVQKTTASNKYLRNKTKLRSKRRKRSDQSQPDHFYQQQKQSNFTTNLKKGNTDRKPKSKRLSDDVTHNRNVDFAIDYYSTSSETSPTGTLKNCETLKNTTNNTTANFGTCKSDQTNFVKSVVSSKKIQLAKDVKDVSKGNLTKNEDVCSNSGNHKCLNNSKKSQFSISMNLKQKFCSIFRFKKSHHSRHSSASVNTQLKDCNSTINDTEINHSDNNSDKKINLCTRALPPLPPVNFPLQKNGKHSLFYICQ